MIPRVHDVDNRAMRRVEIIERLVLISWVLKDFGWMTTNVFLGFPFGIISIMLHLILIFIDHRRSFIYYNISLLLWVTGNFLWMTVEYVDITPSSRIHLGPHVPLGGVSEQTLHNMIDTKTVLFALAILVQFFMYIGVYCGRIPIPVEEDEDIVAKNEATVLCYCSKSYEMTDLSIAELENDEVSSTSQHSVDTDTDISIVDSNVRSDSRISLAFIDNTYIVFWIMKDFFWSSGTGDLGFSDAHSKALETFYETSAMVSATATIVVVMISVYLCRRNMTSLWDNITVILWLSANYVWMCGEFFVRYHNMELDDMTEGNDGATRITSCVLFSLAFSVQIGMMGHMYTDWRKRRRQPSRHGGHSIEMSGTPVRYDNVCMQVSPISEAKNPMFRTILSEDSEEELNTVVF